MAMRFQELMATIASVKSISSFSSNCSRTSSNTSSGACVSAIRVSDSVHASAGPFAIGVKRRFAPGVQHVQPLLRFAVRTGVFAVHVEAIGTAIHLRGPHFHQEQERFFQPAVAQIAFDAEQCFDRLWRGFAVIDARFHDDTPFELNSLPQLIPNLGRFIIQNGRPQE